MEFKPLVGQLRQELLVTAKIHHWDLGVAFLFECTCLLNDLFVFFIVAT